MLILFLAPCEAVAQILPREEVELTVDVYKQDRPDYTPPGFHVGDFHISSSLPPDLPGNGLNPLQPSAWLPLYDPMLSQTVAYDDNIYARRRHQSEDMVNTTTEAINALSDWDPPNLLTGGLYAAEENYYVHPGQNTQAYEADLASKVEVLDKGVLGLNGSFTRQPQVRAGIEADANLPFRPVYNEPFGLVSFTQEFGEATAELQYSVDKVAYNDKASEDRNTTLQAVSSYLAYHWNDTTTLYLRPAVQVINYKLNPDQANSRNVSITAGLRYEVAGTFKLEVQGGLQEQEFRNPFFNDVYQPQIGVYALWNLTPETSLEVQVQNIATPLVRFCGLTGADTCVISTQEQRGTGPISATGGPNVYLAASAGFTLQHEFWHDILGELKFSFERDKFDGIRPTLVQETYQMVVNGRYLVNRNVEIDLTYNYFSRVANLPNVNFYNSGPFDESVLTLTMKAGF